MNRLEEIVNAFSVEGSFLDEGQCVGGHINVTYRVRTVKDGKIYQYVLQRINTSLFTNPDELMENIALVTEFSRKKIIEKGGDPERETLNIVKTKDGQYYYRYVDKNNGTYSGCYRMFLYITDSVTYQIVEKPEDFYQAAVAFGDYANLLAEFDASRLHEILPKFHDTRKRYHDFSESLKKDVKNRAEDIQKEIQFVEKRKDYCGRIVELLESGKMPLKVTHNDTKINNVMFDKDTGKYLCVVDLDTIMPGSVCYDFGDSIRFGCNTAAEDEPDLTKVQFDETLFEAYVKGYLHSLRSITPIEKDHLVWGAVLMTYECGMRFLADYLDGDTYFHTTRDGQNLDRARTQFKLVEEMEKRFDRLQRIVEKY